ncbi:O-methyltransferase [Echinicola vietnamensis]|uniref:Putative O-methyltransferase n=1 Tax=Echinicola vietnamensis (strain DSM 17526 / LMG 23754 / KMM 6221) TaxID=926556 RepID=L0FX69_ECHVK|nr:class I SAM-dependent methyltransferase [Echinicola vietnamensis]AGA77245.1 putative O-methyltransferase [Echinicola vietnamensis DSM 17526]
MHLPMKAAPMSDIPAIYPKILAKSKEIGFTMPSDLYIGSLLKTLMLSKPGGNFLEIGTGIGLSLAWMVEGLGEKESLISIDNDPALTAIAEQFFGQDARLRVLCDDGRSWIKSYSGAPFDLIFADAWPGKYSELEETLSLLKMGGFYVIDDMDVQPNWPEGHGENVKQLIATLESREDLALCKMNWSTGLVVGVKTGH